MAFIGRNASVTIGDKWKVCARSAHRTISVCQSVQAHITQSALLRMHDRPHNLGIFRAQPATRRDLVTIRGTPA